MKVTKWEMKGNEKKENERNEIKVKVMKWEIKETKVTKGNEEK